MILGRVANAKVHVKLHVSYSFRCLRKEKTLSNQGFILVKVVELGDYYPMFFNVFSKFIDSLNPYIN